jgi:outer membrane immunogenic protein
MLIYVTGGVAVGHVDYSATYFITQPNAFGAGGNLRSSETHVGYVLGAGIERALRSNWSLKLEYQYLNFGDQQAEGPLFDANGRATGEKATTSFDTDMHTVRIGLNYHFDAPRHEPLKP